MSTDFSMARAVHAAITSSDHGQVTRLKMAADLNVSELVLRDSLEPHVTSGVFTCRRGPATGRDGVGPIVYGMGPRFKRAFSNAEDINVHEAPAPARAAADPVQAAPAGLTRPPRASAGRKGTVAIDFSALVPRSGVPIPPSGSGNPGESKWAAALQKLAVGEHFIFPEGTESAVNKAAVTHGKRMNKAFRMRKIMHEGKPAIGLWRIEDPKPGVKS